MAFKDNGSLSVAWIVAGIMSGLFVVAWWLFGRLVSLEGELGLVGPWVAMIAGLLVYALLLLMEIPWKIWWVATAASSFSALFFFHSTGDTLFGLPKFLFAFVGALILWGLLYAGAIRSAEERRERITMRPRRVIPVGLSRALTGVALALALFFLASPAALTVAPEFTISPTLVREIIAPFGGVAGFNIPEETWAVTADELAVFTAMSEGRVAPQSVLSPRTFQLLRESNVSLESEDLLAVILNNPRLLASLREDLSRYVAGLSPARREQLRALLSEQAGVPVAEDDTVADIIAHLLSRQLFGERPTALEGTRTVIPGVLAVILFGLLRLLAVPLMWLLVLLAWIAMGLLMRVGLVQEEVETVEKKRLVLV